MSVSESGDNTSNPSNSEQLQQEDYYHFNFGEGEPVPDQKCIAVGEYLPYGLRLFNDEADHVVRMKDIGEKNRILVVGVLGSFTPDCWNRHLFQVLKKLPYYQERDVAHICCVSTNDPYTHAAWGDYLGCTQNVLMWADTYKHFTKKIGMDIIVPWLDNTIRSKRYVILADDMMVTKMIVAPKDHLVRNWQCDHIAQDYYYDDDNVDDDDDDDDDDDFRI